MLLAVACHDFRLGEIKSGETVVVLGGDPIGMLVGLVAKSRGAKVILSEAQDFRLKLSKELGFDSISPEEQDLVAYVEGKTKGTSADAVFEVSGSKAAVEVRPTLLVHVVGSSSRAIEKFSCSTCNKLMQVGNEPSKFQLEFHGLLRIH
jgi:threonine dehydrogenase-like Zn-dependent dehydrogenase